MQIVWWIIFGISVINYAVLVGFVFPKIFFRPGGEIRCTLDCVLKNFKEKNGRSIVYKPRPNYRKYISQYIISDRGNKKSLLCKLNENLTYLDYDVALFNHKDKVFHVLNVKENIIKHGYSSMLELPPRTMYATLIVNYADDICVSSENISKITYRKSALFVAIASLLMILEVFFAKLCLSNIFGEVYVDDFMASANSIFISFFICFVLAIVNLVVAVLYVKFRNKKNRKLN